MVEEEGEEGEGVEDAVHQEEDDEFVTTFNYTCM